MVSSKRIGFYWGEERVTLVEFDKNAPQQVISSPVVLKTNTASPFSSEFSEEIQMTTILQNILNENKIKGGTYYVSLPMKEIILRSFVIPFVKKDDIPNAVKFEAKKYLPIDIQELTFVFYTTAFTENKVKRLQVVFYAVRKESLGRYERIFKQVNSVVSYGEPCVISLTKVLLFKKEIKPTDHLAFLTLDKNSGSICFIDQGLPQFVREFSINSLSLPGEIKDSNENLNLRIVNEVGNSFDFYARQFGGEKMEQMLVSSQDATEGLLNSLETELKIKLRKISPIVSMGTVGEANDMDSIYAMGACLVPPIPSLSGFNFLESKAEKGRFDSSIIDRLAKYKEILFLFFICMAVLGCVNIFFQAQLKTSQKKYDQLLSTQGAYASVTVESISQDTAGDVDKLNNYKNIRLKSDMALILLRVASHLPQGTALRTLDVQYVGNSSKEMKVNATLLGEVALEDSSKRIAVVNQISSDCKNDKELAPFINDVVLKSINIEKSTKGEVAVFIINLT